MRAATTVVCCCVCVCTFYAVVCVYKHVCMYLGTSDSCAYFGYIFIFMSAFVYERQFLSNVSITEKTTMQVQTQRETSEQNAQRPWL